MPTITAKMTGKQDIIAKLDARLAKMQRQVGDAIQGAGIDTEALAKQKCPVGTPESTGIKGYAGGRLRSSIRYQKTGNLSCTVGTNVRYAAAVELGHVTRNPSVHVPPRPYMFPAFIQASRQLQDELRSMLP